jgi:hypothetical protein
MIVPNARVEGLTADGDLLVVIPPAFRDAARAVVNKCILNHSGFCRISLERPSKPKTTGEKSQNNHAWGHATQIAAGLKQGDDPRDVLYDACIATAEYPSRMNVFGVIHAQSWSEATTVQAAAVIETLHRWAAEFGIPLVEGENER